MNSRSTRLDAEHGPELRGHVPGETILAEYEYVRCNHADNYRTFHSIHATPHRPCLMK
ncbi:MAG: hypothetical protein ACTJGY_14855 [Glutamicibacter arilaitensis]|uniref:hypothetical protein n=1 Tax=Glutamicibacter arilaitensis TaxID=256701 RepID=UPI003FCF5CF1